MKRNSFSEIEVAARDMRLISTDIFDTLLLRTGRSERSRIFCGEKLFSELLARKGFAVPADLLVDARLVSQRLAFRALSVGGIAGEVLLRDILARQLAMLGLPASLVEERLNIEIQVEKQSLTANVALADMLRSLRSGGKRVVAISDTTLPRTAVEELITHFHGDDILDCIYTSADHQLTKRDRGLFTAVSEIERVPPSALLHIGDDATADVRAPNSIGVRAVHLPRPRYRTMLRLSNGALSESRRIARRGRRKLKISRRHEPTARAFGEAVLGPIVAQFCVLTWLYATQAAAGQGAALLFCARGGIGIREAFERVLKKLSLQLDMPRENLMVSRLVAARGATLARSVSAAEELESEFRDGLLSDVAKALGGGDYALGAEWSQPFSAQKFLDMLFSSSGAPVLADIEAQHALFTRHLHEVTRGASRIVLCDTGLYGSTQRLLTSAFPQTRLETVQFARSNYKGLSEEHFTKVTGLFVQDSFYNPADIHSCVLRYWHLIERLFEPSVQSVRSFCEDASGQVSANCGDIRYGKLDPAAGNDLLSGALQYIESLPERGGAIVFRDAEVAWVRLKRAITNPVEAEIEYLGTGTRSVDFGRPGTVDVMTLAPATTFSKLKMINHNLWREGAIVREFPLLKHALLPALGAALSIRGAMKRRNRR